MSESNALRHDLNAIEVLNTVLQICGKGVYTLVLLMSTEKRVAIGRLGVFVFAQGVYTYTGSALGKGDAGLRRRIKRHLAKDKKQTWHIDYLLSEKDVKVQAVIAARTRRRIECRMNQLLKERFQARTPVHGFGSSDCKEMCGSHLLQLVSEVPVPKIAELYLEETEGQILVVDLLRKDKGKA